MIKLCAALYIGIVLISPHRCLAQATSGQIMRSEELLQKEEDMRSLIEKDNRFFIREIQISGATKLNNDQIQTIALSYQNKWLTKSSFEQILTLLEEQYSQNGFPKDYINARFTVNKDILEIKIEEGAKK